MGRPKTQGTQKRTERATLLMTQEDYDGLYILAQMQDRTINDFACAILSSIVQKNSAVIEKFKDEKKKYADALNLTVDDDAGQA